MSSRRASKSGVLAALLPDLSLLRRPGDFRLLYFGYLISGFGSALTYVVLPVQMYRLTHSTVMVGLLSVAEFVPMLLVAFVGGALADHFNRRDILLVCDTSMSVVLAVLTANALRPHPDVWLLFGAAGLLAALNSVQRPAIEAMTPQLVGSEEMTAVSALNSIRGNAAFIAGPGVAGWVAVP